MPEVEEEEERQDRQMSSAAPEGPDQAAQPGAELQQRQQQQSSAPLQSVAFTDREAPDDSPSGLGATVTERDGVAAASPAEAAAVASVLPKPVSTSPRSC